MATPLSADPRTAAEPVALPRARGAFAAWPRRVTPWLATALALPIVVALAVELAVSSEHLADPGLVAVYRAYLVATPVLVGLVWWRRRPAGPYGPLLAALGLAALTLAVESSDRPALFTLGVVGESVYFSLLMYVCVAFPSGQSKLIRFGCGAVRLWNVYMPRRYRSSPGLVVHLKLLA